MTTAVLEREILVKLRDADGNAIAEDRLYRDVLADSALPIRRLDFTATLRAMEARRELFGLATLDGAKWSIQPNGLSRLAAANL